MIYTAVNKTQAMLEGLAENYTSQKIRDKKDVPDPSAQREGYSQNGNNGQHLLPTVVSPHGSFSTAFEHGQTEPAAQDQVGKECCHGSGSIRRNSLKMCLARASS